MLTNKFTWFCFGYFGFAALYFICAWFITGGAFAAYEQPLDRYAFVMLQLLLGILAGVLSVVFGYNGYMNSSAALYKRIEQVNKRI